MAKGKAKRLPRSIRPPGRAWPYKPAKSKRKAAAAAKPEQVREIIIHGIHLGQVLAFADAFLSSKPILIHLGAILGLGNVPALEDFQRPSEMTLPRAEALLRYLENVTKQLDGHLRAAPRQGELDFTGRAVQAASKVLAEKGINGTVEVEGVVEPEGKKIEEPVATAAATV